MTRFDIAEKVMKTMLATAAWARARGKYDIEARYLIAAADIESWLLGVDPGGRRA